MVKTHFKIAIRNLVKHKRFTLLNILGLAVGLASFLLILLWVRDELSYDRFHENADDIYIVFRNNQGKPSGVTSKMLAPALQTDVPEIIDATAFAPLPESFQVYVEYENNGFEEELTLAESQFFDIFSFEFISGDYRSAFDDPNSVVMTERMKQKYFGEKDALGESITLTALGQESRLKVTGIMENFPSNSHIQRDFFVPLDFIQRYGANWDAWFNQPVFTYIRTTGNVTVPELEQKILDCKQGYYEEERISYSLMPLADIHLHATNVGFFTTTGDIKYVYIFSAIAVIILLIACVNYMNISTALSLRRSRDIGMNKVMGARRTDIIRQYFGETVLLTIVALGCAIVLVELFLPTLDRLTGKSLSVDYFSPQLVITLVLTTLVTSLISGFYPAIFMSGFQPIRILQEKFVRGSSNHNLRRGLIIFQFALSIIIIVSTITVMNQLSYIRNSNLGYDKEHVVALRLKDDISGQYTAFKNRLLSNTAILSMTRSEPVDASSLGRTEGVEWPGKEEKFNTWLLHVDYDFAETYLIEMQSGRFYSREHPSDETSAYVVNQAAAREMGFTSPVGSELTVWGRTGSIIGVVKDFNFASLHHAIEPVILRIPTPDQRPIYYREISIRYQSGTAHSSLEFIRDTWQSFFPDEPFDYYYFDNKLNASYDADFRMGTVFWCFSVLAIFIACLGLYGLTAFTIEQTQKDIGVRKVLGASIPDIALLFSKHYVWLIVLANLLAWPVAWYAMNRWLQNFAYRIDITVWPFLLAGFGVLVIALLTINWQAIRAATANPVEALRYE